MFLRIFVAAAAYLVLAVVVAQYSISAAIECPPMSMPGVVVPVLLGLSLGNCVYQHNYRGRIIKRLAKEEAKNERNSAQKEREQCTK